MDLVGYKLINVATGDVIEQWGGQWGQCPGMPSPIFLPSGDQVVAMQLDEEIQGCKLVRWEMDRPPPGKDDIQVERDRRIDAGFVFDNVVFQSRQEDRENVAGAVSWASLAIMSGAQPGDYLWHGGAEDFAWIAADNSLVKMDAPTVIEFGKALGAWKSAHIFAARALKDLPEIPADYRDAKYWPVQKIEEVQQ